MNQFLPRIVLSVFLATVFSATVSAQAPALPQQRAAENSYTGNFFTAHPEALKQLRKMQDAARINPHYQPQTTVVIPVVFHVVYKTAAQTIDDSVLLNQLQVLNEDYGKMNADTTIAYNVGYGSLVANTGIQFCLATIDPNSAPTTGIERRNTTTISFTTNDNVKHYSSGGLDIWDPTQYLNVWVCNLSAGLLGYAEFPTGNVSPTDGVVVHYACVGRNNPNGQTVAPFNRGRTLTHELGHWFNLVHMNPDPNCVDNDGIADTPPVSDQLTAWPCCGVLTDNCNPTAPGIMYMNFMFYSDADSSQCMFTPGQVAVMWSTLTNLRSSFLNATTSLCTLPPPDDAGIPSITAPVGNLCNSAISPMVTLRNFGSAALTSCTISYDVDNGPATNYSWSGSLAPGQTAQVTLAAYNATNAQHVFHAWTSSPNGNTDGNTANDADSSTYYFFAGGLSLPFSEGFENMTFPPFGWTVMNPDNSYTWERDTLASSSGMASARVTNFYNTAGQADDLITPPLDLTSVPNPQFLFEVAYQLYTDPASNPNYSDTLRIFVSTDCGLTWNVAYNNYGTSLVTATPQFSPNEFIPAQPQWRLDSVSLAPWAGCTNALLKIENISGYENDLYIDDLIANQRIASGVMQMESGIYVNVFPNPSDGNFYADVRLDAPQPMTVTVTDMLGNEVSAQQYGATSGGRYSIDLRAQPAGVYFVKVSAGDFTEIRRITVAK
ncbi:MAG TPA: M43 family zinc metalloprotease [Bacteroidia bacterium]|nr:M43 family zinc metalloprotease [Bacteroidia bacterium]